jgi:hypothetical protein
MCLDAALVLQRRFLRRASALAACSRLASTNTFAVQAAQAATMKDWPLSMMGSGKPSLSS